MASSSSAMSSQPELGALPGQVPQYTLRQDDEAVYVDLACAHDDGNEHGAASLVEGVAGSTEDPEPKVVSEERAFGFVWRGYYLP